MSLERDLRLNNGIKQSAHTDSPPAEPAPLPSAFAGVKNIMPDTFSDFSPTLPPSENVMAQDTAANTALAALPALPAPEKIPDIKSKGSLILLAAAASRDQTIVPETVPDFHPVPIDEMFTELLDKIKLYHPTSQLTLVERAYFLARDAHEDQKRESGEPYIIHPLSVAIILAELELDLESIAAGILHDVIEDTEYTYDDIAALFNEEVALLVEGVTKLEKMRYASKEEQKAENYRKMFLAMARDIRVILIKIADRLHNVRTLEFRPVEKQHSVAQETLDIYAPLAHRLGISRLRYELEDLSFKYIDPDSYFDIACKISHKQSERTEIVRRIVQEVRIILDAAGISASVEGRPKHFFSIYKKMITKNKSLDQIFDLFAIRVLVNDVRDCYEVLGTLHDKYKPIPGRVKDYIGMPKSNRYQSLHTTLIGEEGEPFEVQIRTWEMHRVAENGIAAHWRYKQNQAGKTDRNREEAKLTWLKNILDWQRELSDDKEYLDALKLDLNVFKDHVYCFTPKGEVVSLISGSTPIDFAYAIHSAVGNKMVGAKVNGHIVTFDYTLATGDKVDIVTSQSSRGPGRDWLKLVKTSQARSKINQWFKQENRVENVLRGRELLEAEAKKKSISLTEILADGRDMIVCSRFNCPDFDSLCAAVGYGGVKDAQVISRLYNEYEKTLPVADPETIIQDLLDDVSSEQRDRKKKSGIIVKGVGDSNVRISKCCSALPGDDIVGFVTRGRGVTIHRIDCPNILNIKETDRKRIIEASWQLPEKNADSVAYHADLRIVCTDRNGLLVDLSRVWTDERIKIKTLNVRTLQTDAIFDLGVEVASREQLDHLFNRILRQPDVHEVDRVIS